LSNVTLRCCETAGGHALGDDVHSPRLVPAGSDRGRLRPVASEAGGITPREKTEKPIQRATPPRAALFFCRSWRLCLSILRNCPCWTSITVLRIVGEQHPRRNRRGVFYAPRSALSSRDAATLCQPRASAAPPHTHQVKEFCRDSIAMPAWKSPQFPKLAIA
jgi:hypothetical protein